MQHREFMSWEHQTVSEYSWPQGEYAVNSDSVRRAWKATVAATPRESTVTGIVIGRQPFGVFVRIDGLAAAVGLAEVFALPRDTVMPALGTRVAGVVIEHAEHNHQVRIQLTAWETASS